MLQDVEIRVVGVDGGVRHREPASFTSAPDIWGALAALARDRGRQGDSLQVLDQDGEVLIRIGVSTARDGARRSAA